MLSVGIKEHIQLKLITLTPEQRNKLARESFTGVCICCGEYTSDENIQCAECGENRLYLTYFGGD